MNQDKWDLRTISTDMVRESPEKLRDVDTDDEEFILLKNSIANIGLIQPIFVREMKDSETGEVRFGLIDGLQRYTACTELGMKNIPAHVVNLSDAEIFEAQLIANARRVETKPAQFGEHLRRILHQNPTMTKTEICDRVNCSMSQLYAWLGLKNLVPSIAEMADNGQIKFANVVALSKLPHDMQMEHLEEAQTTPTQEFNARMLQLIKEIKAANRQGRSPNTEWQPTPKPRSVKDIKTELDTTTSRDMVLQVEQAKTIQDAWKSALKWAIHMDQNSINESRAKHEQDKERQKKDRELRKQEKEQKEQELAALRAEQARETANVA